MFSLHRANARNYRRTWGRGHHEWWSTFPHKWFSKQTELSIVGRTKSPWSAWKPLQSPKATVWCAIGKVGVIGPYFFEENGITMTINSAQYTDMINNFLEPELRSRRMGPPLTLPEPQWLLFEPCSLIASLHDVVMFPGLLGHPTFRCAIFFCGATSSRVFTKESHKH